MKLYIHSHLGLTFINVMGGTDVHLLILLTSNKEASRSDWVSWTLLVSLDVFLRVVMGLRWILLFPQTKTLLFRHKLWIWLKAPFCIWSLFVYLHRTGQSTKQFIFQLQNVSLCTILKLSNWKDACPKCLFMLKNEYWLIYLFYFNS